ncbi:PepSY domain-containing protein [Staphylococcus massiliensis]|uniref:PepSY-associated TM helix domain-containing protein n=1 Tax=Staphylococcus massiliensis TaxID=555791 RepID=UPI001EDEFB2C|nr:PepSY domain-containing protein [Staphylococcus massiliensis]MCG3402027.1 PepSY domain-containing protein [Staphylococcus massiliensis]
MRNTLNLFQRLHIYAAFFIAPLLITLTISGIGYLYFQDVEKQIYHEALFEDSHQSSEQSMKDAVKEIEHKYQGYQIDKVMILDNRYNDRVEISNQDGDTKYVFLDKDHQIVTDQNARWTYANIMRDFHSSLLTRNTVLNYLVELTACWTIFMIVSGLYMLFKKRIHKQNAKALKFQKIHALIGMIVAIPVFLLVLTGLPWSAFSGDKIHKLSMSSPSLGTTETTVNPPKSDVNEIPWATRSSNEPKSDEHAGHHAKGHPITDGDHQLPIDTIIEKANKNNVTKPYSIVYPTSSDEAYTVAKSSNTGITGLDVSPYEETTLYIDQYSGKKLAQVNYNEYGIIDKWFSWGIPLHEGHLFGIANKIINTIVALMFLGGIFFGFYSWIKRVVKGNQQMPKRTKKPMSKAVIVLMVVLGLLMPLFGASLIIILMIEGLLKLKNRKHSVE